MPAIPPARYNGSGDLLMAKRTNRVAWGLVTLLVGALVGSGLLFVRLAPYLRARYRGEAANLQRVVLPDAHLRGANLLKSRLWSSNLRGAHLEHASLYQAELNSANLTGAHLSDADLTGAWMDFADLSGADLAGA